LSTFTLLQGRWLTLIRTAWVIIAAFYIVGYLVAMPISLSETPDVTSSVEGVTQTEYLAGLAQLGISPDGYFAFSRWMSIALPLLYFGLGFFIFWRKSDDWMALSTSILLITFLGSFNELSRLNPIWKLPGDISDIATSILFILWLFIFPDGHFVPRWMRWVFFLLLAMQVWRIFQPDVYMQSFPFVALSLFGGILLSQVYRYRHTGAAQRQQIKWVVYGLVVGTAPLVLFFLLYFTVLSSLPPVTRAILVELVGGLLWRFLLLILPISLTFAILRSHLLDIDVVIRKTLTYAIVVALLLVVYSGSVVLLQQIFASVTGQRSEITTVLSTLAIAVLFVPLRNRVQAWIDRRFYRKKYDAQKVLSDFAETVRDETDLEKLTARLMQVVDETMQPRSVSVWLKKLEESK